MSDFPAFDVDANVVQFDVVDSTNAAAGRLVARWCAEQDARLPETVLLARTQSAGRGRGGNRWHSPAGGVYFTWLGELEVEQLPVAPLAAGVALLEALQAVVPTAPLGLKWPNDVLAGGAKLAGVLCQSRVQPARSWLAVGCGVNVMPVSGVHEAFGLPATSLGELGFAGPPEAAALRLVSSFVPRLRAGLAASAQTTAVWAARSVHRVGDPIRVRSDDGPLDGSFVGFTDDGRLTLEVGGSVRVVSVGDLVGPLPEAGG